MNHNPQCDVPPIVTDLIEFIRENGMNIEGIFRRSASVSTIKNLQLKIDLGKKFLLKIKILFLNIKILR